MDRYQEQQQECHTQWTYFEDNDPLLFKEWIQPLDVSVFDDQVVIDAGCGPGHHIRHVAPFAKKVIGVDLNTATIARERLSELKNVEIYEGDIAVFRPPEVADIVYCIGVIHHTDDPDKTFENLIHYVEPGGIVIVWCYSKEGNELVAYIVEPLRKLFLRWLPRPVLTFLIYPFVYTIYLLPLDGLPYYEYFQNWRRLSLHRNMLNVFDKLNAPQTEFISRDRIGQWFNDDQFENVIIKPYKGVSYTGIGYRKSATEDT